MCLIWGKVLILVKKFKKRKLIKTPDLEIGVTIRTTNNMKESLKRKKLQVEKSVNSIDVTKKKILQAL